MPKADVKAARGAARQNLVYSEGHRKIVVVSSSMLRLWMVDWAMGSLLTQSTKIACTRDMSIISQLPQ